MDIVEQEIISSMSRAMFDCNDARAEELYRELKKYRAEVKSKVGK